MAHVRKVERKDGAIAYEARWRQNGKFKQRTFKVKREADRFALRVEDEVEQGNSTEVYTRRSKTVRDVVEASMVANEKRLKPRTFNSYRQNYDNHVLPALGARRVATITSQDVELWVASLVEKGLSPATVRNNFVALTKAMKYAARHSLIVRNPCEGGAHLPRQAHGEEFVAQILTPAQIERLAVQLDDAAPYGLMVRLAAYSGLRAAEMAGLRVRDVNLFRKHIEVRRTVQRVKGGWAIGTPKSRRSTRDVPILRSDLLYELQAHLAAHPRRGEPDAPLWPGRVIGSHVLDYTRPFDHQSFYRWYYKPALRSVNLPDIRFHDLRHTAASVWLAAGIEPFKVSRWLGHASLATTDTIYSHLYPSDHADDVAALEDFVRRAGIAGDPDVSSAR